MPLDREERPPSPRALARSVQANFGRASHFANGKTRDWSLFFFFRILSKEDIRKDLERLEELHLANTANVRGDASARTAAAKTAAARAFLDSLEDPALANAEFPRGVALAPEGTPAAEPSSLFLQWLKLLVDAKNSGLGGDLRKLLGDAGIEVASRPRRAAASNADRSNVETSSGAVLVARLKALAERLAAGSPQSFLSAVDEAIQGFPDVVSLLVHPDKFVELFGGFGELPGPAGLTALSGGLSTVCIYEVLRQLAPAYLGPGAPPGLVRSEFSARPEHGPTWDAVPVNVTFTFSGLNAVALDPVILDTFPEAFKDGMAARAARLGDTGPSAPEKWSGALGLPSIHGYFTGGFQVGDHDHPVPASSWQNLRDDIHAFNEYAGERGATLRLLLAALFRPLGMQIMHIELGEDPYVVEHGHVRRLPYRTEHFGFRDGISQPFVDLGFGDPPALGDPPAGSGTPGPNHTWTPLAAGEIYLDQPDEDGTVPQQPLPHWLREGSTFVVFRKLEQDVPGFRMFLARQRPGDRDARYKLASQFVGRWQNGTPLVLAPDAALELGSDSAGEINDFLYAADDPLGAHCPLGAHVRRTNPRDIGDANDVRRHRILRRSFSFGGKLLPENELGDGNKRGLLFIAVNSRIDLQFEVIQASWINTGEFLGQAGLGRCPITGANQSGPSDTFLEAGAVAPVVDLPRFVLTRGGDYFFAPGLEALKVIAEGPTPGLPTARLPNQGYSMGDAATPSLIAADRLQRYARAMLSRQASVVTVALPPTIPPVPGDPQGQDVTFVAQYDDVTTVLSTDFDKDGAIVFSVEPYREASRRISRGYDLFVATEPGVHSPTAGEREVMGRILNGAWEVLYQDGAVRSRMDGITAAAIEAALRRTRSTGNIDLVHDLAATVVYRIVTDLIGVPGPPWLTELGVALPFARQHLGELHPDWLAALKGATPGDPGFVTLQIWSILMFADIVGNYQHQAELMALSLQAGSEFLTQLDTLMATAAPPSSPQLMTLLQAFGAIEPNFVPVSCTHDQYVVYVRMLLMEVAGSAMAIIPTAFGGIMGSLLDFGIDLTRLVPILLAPPQHGTPDPPDSAPANGLDRLIYETTRVNPTFQMFMRRAAVDAILPSGGKVAAGNMVMALVGAAGMDPLGPARDHPEVFSLWPYQRGPQRDLKKYILFGAPGGGRECWGRDRIALYVLKECLKAAGRLQGLRRIAGETGDLQKLLKVNIGLKARFATLLPPFRPPGSAPRS